MTTKREQIERNEKKDADRPKAIIENRARAKAAEIGVPFAFMWVNMNWQALVDDMRAKMAPGAKCNSCGHPFAGESDIQIEHIEPPRHPQDWARQHARNFVLMCQSCTATMKAARTYRDWLHDQEDARLANERSQRAERNEKVDASAPIAPPSKPPKKPRPPTPPQMRPDRKFGIKAFVGG